MPLIALQAVSKSYRQGLVESPALREITVAVEQGTLVTVIGPSGSGKTTLLNIIGCMDKPGSGTVQVDRTRTDTLDRGRRRIFARHPGFIFQAFNLIPVLTVYENVEYPLIMIRKTPAAERRARVLRVLEAVGMAGYKDKRPDQISGGGQKELMGHKTLNMTERYSHLAPDALRRAVALLDEQPASTGTVVDIATGNRQR